MSTNNIQYALYKDDDQMEEAMLRSVLLFDSIDDGKKKSDFITKAVLGLIIKGDGKYTVEKIVKIMNDRFSMGWVDNDASHYIKKLIKKDLIRQEGEGKDAVFIGIEHTDFFTSLDEELNEFVNGVLIKLKSVLRENTSQLNETQIRSNVTQALSVYYKMFGYEYFKLMRPGDNSKKMDAVSIAKNRLDSRTGELLVRTLADIIQNPTKNELAFLEKWAKVYVTTQVLNLDPTLRNMKLTKLRDKTFVVDTDVALNCLTTKAKYSKVYGMMIEKLKSIGCKIILPYGVVDEIGNHGDAAIKQYNWRGEALMGMPDETLENEVANVFVEDYIKLCKSDNSYSDVDFVDYLSNIYDKQYPSVLNKKITKSFGKNCFDDGFENKAVDQEKLHALSNKLLEKVVDTPKSMYRSVEENRVMCDVDAKIFLTIIDENKDDVSEDNLLAHKTYLLTQSKRTVYAAKELGYYEKDVICNPNSLIAILNETGTLKTDMDIVNLFENPFLVYTSEQVWNEIQPLLNAGVKIKGKDIDRLRLDVDVKFDKILTGTMQEKVEESKRLTERGYSFPKEMADLAVENEEKSKKIEELEKEIEQLKTVNRNLKDGTDKSLISKMKKRKK